MANQKIIQKLDWPIFFLFENIKELPTFSYLDLINVLFFSFRIFFIKWNVRQSLCGFSTLSISNHFFYYIFFKTKKKTSACIKPHLYRNNSNNWTTSSSVADWFINVTFQFRTFKKKQQQHPSKCIETNHIGLRSKNIIEERRKENKQNQSLIVH